MSTFIEEQLVKILQLRGASVVSWSGVEMAIRESGQAGHPVFSDPSVPYLQFLALRARIDSGEYIKFVTYQNDDNWGLCLTSLEAEERPYIYNAGDIFRDRVVAELPLGAIAHANYRLDEFGDLERVDLIIGEVPILLIAGEVYEEFDGTLRIQLGGDESVLVAVGAASNTGSPRR